jgi:HEAT repeat protein
MTTLVLALSVLLGRPLASLQQDVWTETTFHRIYLRNGNFIDGRIVSDKPDQVILRLASGEMIVKRDQIDRLELIKIRSVNEAAPVLNSPKAPSTAPLNPGAPLPTVTAPELIRKKIDQMILKAKKTQGEVDFNLAELQSTGDEGAAYLASKAAENNLNIQNAIMAVLINLKKPGPKLAETLDNYLSAPTPSMRGLALTVLTVEAGDSQLVKYARPALRDPDAGVRLIAISAVNAVEDPIWLGDALDLIADSNKDVRARALTLCKRLSAKNGLVEKLLSTATRELRNSNAEIRAEMATVIGTLGVRQAWSNLTPLLSDSDASVRASAAQSLMQLAESESAADLIVAMRREDDKWVRIYLAGAAQRMRLQDAVSPMVPWLSDPDPDLLTAVETSLRTITGEPFGRDQAKWNAWLQARGK